MKKQEGKEEDTRRREKRKGKRQMPINEIGEKTIDKSEKRKIQEQNKHSKAPLRRRRDSQRTG